MKLIGLFNIIFIAQAQITQVSQTQQHESNQVHEDLETGGINGFFNLEQIRDILNTLQIQFPSFIYLNQSIGLSTQGREIPAIRFGYKNQKDAQRIMFVGLLHGNDDLISTNYICQMLLEFTQNSNRILENKEIWIIVALNVDTLNEINQQFKISSSILKINKNRKNYFDNWGNQCNKNEFGVDLGKNYPYMFYQQQVDQCSQNYQGPRPLSEYESQALGQFIQQQNPQLIIFIGGGFQQEIIIPRFQFAYAEESYGVLLNSTEQKYNIPINQAIDDHGDVCEYLMSAKGILCFKLNLGQGDLHDTIYNYSSLPIEIFKRFGTYLQLIEGSSSSCSDNRTICSVIKDKQAGFVTSFFVMNGGLKRLEEEQLIITFTIQQMGENIISLSTIEIDYRNKTTNMLVDQTRQDLFGVQFQCSLESGETIKFTFLSVKEDSQTSQIKSIEQIISLQNSQDSQRIIQTIQIDRFSQYMQSDNDSLFPNRSESYIILIIFAFISLILVVVTAVREIYFYINLSKADRLVKQSNTHVTLNQDVNSVAPTPSIELAMVHQQNAIQPDQIVEREYNIQQIQ